MEKFIVKGEVRLTGTIRTSGAKNATLPIMAAALLASGTSILHQVPLLRDVQIMQEMLAILGAGSRREGQTLLLDASSLQNKDIAEQLMREMRASIFLLGPLLHRFQRVRLYYPGGCAIGPRPIDLHIKALERLGAQCSERHGYIEVYAERLHGADIQFDYPSVGATENTMMAAVLADGTTIIRNAAREPEIQDLQSFLVRMGAKMSGAGTDTIRIDGVRHLRPAEHTVMPDRIQAATLLLAGAITRGDVTVEAVVPEHISAVTAKLQEMGARVDIAEQSVRVRCEALRGVDIKTLPYPGFPTDLQAPILALLTIAQGTSILTETIFENRFKHINELMRMGARIKMDGRTAIIRGVKKLSGTVLTAPDLRAGAALVLAALAAEGTSEIEEIYHVDRGYEALEQSLQQLGAEIQRQHG